MKKALFRKKIGRIELLKPIEFCPKQNGCNTGEPTSLTPMVIPTTRPAIKLSKRPPAPASTIEIE